MKKRKFTIGQKVYLFVGITVFFAAFGAALISYIINARQIDGYFKNLSLHSARNFAQFIDTDFYSRLKEVAVSPEYQAIRTQAEENEDEAPIEKYLKEKIFGTITRKTKRLWFATFAQWKTSSTFTLSFGAERTKPKTCI